MFVGRRSCPLHITTMPFQYNTELLPSSNNTYQDNVYGVGSSQQRAGDAYMPFKVFIQTFDVKEMELISSVISFAP